MTVGEAIRRAEKQRPGIRLTGDEYLSHLNRLEADIYSNIISRHEGAGEFALHTHEDDVLQVPDMYAELYKFYLLALIDIGNGDITRYSNNMVLYNNLLSLYSDWYTRNHMPLSFGKLGWM